MQVLGTANAMAKPSQFDPSYLHAYTNTTLPYPQIFCSSEIKVSIQVIVFDRPFPGRMQYMSLDPISLALGIPSASDEKSNFTEHFKSGLIDKLRLHTVVRQRSSRKELLLLILTQINCSFELAQLLSKNAGHIGARPRRTLSVSERVVESATSLWDFVVDRVWQILTIWVYPIMTRAFIIGLICHRFVAEVVLLVLGWRVRPESVALRDVSATAQQVDIRLQQFCYWPIQYTTLRRRKDEWESVTDSHPDYIRFYNSLWLVANDVIIGIALGSYIIDNADWVAARINKVLTDWTILGLQSRIMWLTDWPAGLKLNNELATFLGDLFLWVIDYWSSRFNMKLFKLRDEGI